MLILGRVNIHEIYLRSLSDASACWETQCCAVTFSKCISTGGCHHLQAPELGDLLNDQERLIPVFVCLFGFSFHFPHPLDLPLCYQVANSISLPHTTEQYSQRKYYQCLRQWQSGKGLLGFQISFRVAPRAGVSEGRKAGVAGSLEADGRVSSSNSKASHNGLSPRNLRKQKWGITPVYYIFKK